MWSYYPGSIRRRRARDEGSLGADPLLVYYTHKDLFRFSDGTFALSPERENWPTLKEKGFFSEWGM